MGPVSIGVEVQQNTDGDTPSRCFITQTEEKWAIESRFQIFFIKFFYSVLDLLLINPSRCKKYTPDLNFEKIASLTSQLGSSGSDLGFHTRPF